MKIKINLFGMEQLEELDNNLELQAMCREIGVDVMKIPYIELDTGGQFDDYPKENQKHLETGIGSFLQRFGQLLLAGINFDIATQSKGLETRPGIIAIEQGLMTMEKGMEIAAQISAPE